MAEEHSIDWSFLERVIEKNISVAEESRKRYSRIGKVRSHKSTFHTLDFQGPSIDHVALEKVAEARRKNGWNNYPFDLDRIEQTYALACNLRYGHAVKLYAEKATEFLGEMLGLDISPFKWRLLHEKHDYPNFNNQCVVVDDFVTLRTYRIFKDTSSGSYIDLQRLISRGGGGVLEYDSNGRWFIGISDDKTAIQTPFSEILPVFLSDKEDEAYGLDKAGRLTAGETISESMAYMLAHEMVGKMGIPNGHKVIDQNLDELLARQLPQYNHVNRGISWIKKQNGLGKDGIREAFSLFMENPIKYMDTIGATSSQN